MCCMLKFMPLMGIVPIAILLTLSFFVLYALRKVEEKGLKIFGTVVAILLWIAALVIFSGSVYMSARGPMMGKGMMPQRSKMDCMSKMMQKNNMTSMSMPEREQSNQKQKPSVMSKCGGNKGIVYKAE